MFEKIRMAVSKCFSELPERNGPAPMNYITAGQRSG